MSRLDLVTEALECLKATEHLDEDWAVPCEREGPPTCRGENVAEWIAFFKPCCPGRPMQALWCTPCVKRVLDLAILRCTSCSAVHDHPRIEPLNRRTT